ncbi:hypothetical protein [Deinococcus sp.]|uniref:hypothetical protein n=1 Tax=Deinococcus sp. TaxID=47478 RepID=UPI00286E4AA3|nr:hypothetical protein [Deinococcus sp.]
MTQTLATPVSLPRRSRQRLENYRRRIKLGATPEPLPPALKPLSDTPTMNVLGEASGWRCERGYEHLDTGDDDSLAVPIRLDLLAQAQAAAERVNVSAYLV